MCIKVRQLISTFLRVLMFPVQRNPRRARELLPLRALGHPPKGLLHDKTRPVFDRAVPCPKFQLTPPSAESPGSSSTRAQTHAENTPEPGSHFVTLLCMLRSTFTGVDDDVAGDERSPGPQNMEVELPDGIPGRGVYFAEPIPERTLTMFSSSRSSYQAMAQRETPSPWSRPYAPARVVPSYD